MNGHECVRKLLPLVAAGTISPMDLRKVHEHLAQCELCRSISEDFAALGSALRGLPTPQPRVELLAHVRNLAESRLADRTAQSREAAVLAPLVAASWIVALLTWPVVQAAGRWVLAAWYVQGDGIGSALVAYSIVGFLLACTAAIAVGRRAGAIGRAR